MKAAYRNALHAIDMDESKKNELVDYLSREAAEHTSVVKMPKRSSWRRMLLRVAAAVVACTVMAGGVAYAAGPYMTLSDAFDALFNGAPARTEVMDSIGRPVGAAAYANGVTISADAIIGDASSYSIVYSITWEDGVPDAVAENVVDLYMDGGSHVLGSSGSAGSAYFYDNDPSDNTVHYVEQLFIDSADGIIGRTCTVDFDRILHIAAESADPDSAQTVVAEGGWNLRFTIDYQDESIALPTGQALAIDGRDTTVTALTISPVSLLVEYDVQSGDDTDALAEPQELPAVRDLGTITIVMNDGSRMTFESDTCAASVSMGDGIVHCKLNKIFESAIDLEDVSSIELGGVSIPVH